jgi:hypothetical protein
MRVTGVGLTAAYSAASFGATTLDTAQAPANRDNRFAELRGTESICVNLRQTIMSAVMAVFLGSCR